MGYALHLERSSNGGVVPITTDEWRAAIQHTAGVRLSEHTNHTVVNPHTGEVISIVGDENDAEVFIPSANAWQPVFKWNDGTVGFGGTIQIGNMFDPVWIAATSLAAALNADIRGDDDELYDLETGEAIEEDE